MSAHDALDQDHSGLLSDAALTALNLRHQPFTSELRDAAALYDDTSDATAEPFSDAVTDEQLADIKQALITGDDLLLILGENGAGKTTLLEQLNVNSGLRIQCFSVAGSERFSTLNLFAGMLEAFKQKPPEKLKDVLDKLIPHLQAMIGRNTLSTIVLDDAHRVKHSELTQLLSGMLYMNSQDETLMRVALSATSEFEDTIPDLLPEGADMPYSSLTIEGFSPYRAATYLDYRLQLAGFEQEFPFSERDMASLVDHSGGRPAELHALTADVFNEKYGSLQDSVPRELMIDEGPGFLQTRQGKLVLGGIATACIIGGLLMFMAGTNDTTQLTDQTESPQDPTLVLIDPPGSAPHTGIDAVDNTQDTAADTNSADLPAVADASPEQDLTNIGSGEVGADADTPQSLDEPAVVTSVTQTTTESTESPEGSNVADATEGVQSVSDNSDAGADSEASDSIADTSQADASQADTSQADAPQADSSQADTATTDTARTESDQPLAGDSVSDATQAATEADTTTDNEQTDAATTTDEPPAEDEQRLDGGPGSDLAQSLESPSWILVQDESQFTIQMSASRDLKSVQDFLRRNPLPSPNSIFSFERLGDVWYALVHGVYPTLSEARIAVEQMPESAQRDQPWIRSIGRVKEVLRVQ